MRKIYKTDWSLCKKRIWNSTPFLCGFILSLFCGYTIADPLSPAPFDATIQKNADTLLEQGRHIFRYDTFGSEDFWGGTLKLHQAVEQLSPESALGLGLKVDMDALPADLIQKFKKVQENEEVIQAVQAKLKDPASTLELLKLNAVVGITGFFDENKAHLKSIGIQCALCHSTVDNSLLPGVGHRLDGWANRDLNVGAIIAAAPDLSYFANLFGLSQENVRKVLTSWGPGKFDAQLILDGKAFRPDGKPAATLLPPAFGLAGVNLHTWTGAWGTVSYWNAFVANLEMGGKGTFYDPRLFDFNKYPIAAMNGFGLKRDAEDLITPKLPALHYYQLSIPSPEPPQGSFDENRAQQGQLLFNGKAKCAQCHVPPLFTDPGWNLHTAEEIGIDDFQANRSPDNRYRTSPLKGLWTHTKGGFYHDGRFATLPDVVNHYNGHLGLGLSGEEVGDIVEYLKSL